MWHATIGDAKQIRLGGDQYAQELWILLNDDVTLDDPYVVRVTRFTKPKMVRIPVRMLGVNGVRTNNRTKDLPREAKRALKLAFPVALIMLNAV